MYTQSRCHLIHQIYIVWHGIDAEVEEKDENRYFPSCVAFVYIRSRHSRFAVCKYICLVIAGGPEPGGSPIVLWEAVISMIVWCEHMKNTSTILPAITPPHPPLLLLVPSGGERKIDDRQDARNLPLPSLSVRLKESLFFFPFFFWNLWNWSSDFTPGTMRSELIRRDRPLVLTTGSVFSRRDLYNTSREAFPLA